jgi:predicted nucleic acid-binding protein
MARNVLVDAGFVVALLSSRDAHHQWAVTKASELPPPWSTCEAVLSEAYHLLGELGTSTLGALLRRGALRVAFRLTENMEPVAKLIEKYSNIPMGFADAGLVRMTETLADPVILTTDQDFRVYRRHNRQVVPCVTPE